jgi:hypothetical protein
MQDKGSIHTPWIEEYHYPDTQPNNPGRGGGSADPYGNCYRCGKPIHREEQDAHNATAHMMGFAKPGTPIQRMSVASPIPSGAGFSRSYRGKHER